MLEAPKSIHEYLRRGILVPWVTAGAVSVIMFLAAAICLFILPAPVDQGRKTKSDLRPIYAGICLAFGVGAVAFAPIKTKQARALLQRGKRTTATSVHVSSPPPGMNTAGMRPVRVTYMVAGQQYTHAEDMFSSQAEALADGPNGIVVVYDPQHPSWSTVIPPGISDSA